MTPPANDRESSGEDRTSESGGEACAVIDAIDRIGSKWRLVVLHDLTDGEKRFNELKRSTGASSRTLSRVLDDLGESGFVDRRLEEESPVATYYSLTEKGRALCPVFDAITEWAEEWQGENPATPETDRVPAESD